MVEISRLDDVMNYFRYAFSAYVVLLIIVVVNFIKALYMKKRCGESSILKKILMIDLLVDILCGVAMASGLMFMGVLSDNFALNINYWADRLSLISLISFIIFIINVVVVFRKTK